MCIYSSTCAKQEAVFPFMDDANQERERERAGRTACVQDDGCSGSTAGKNKIRRGGGVANRVTG